MRIKEVMSERRMTQKELAEAMGVSLSAVKQMVGANSVTTATLEKIASVLDVPVWTLLASPDEVRDSLSCGPAVRCPHCGKPIMLSLKAGK